MHISRRAAAVGAAAVLTGLASLGAAGAASASPAAHARVQVLRLHTVFVSLAVNHAGQGGPGDVTAVVFDLQTPSGAKAGKAYVSCTAATASVVLCHAAYVLHGGQIYAGVTGQARSVDTGPGTGDRTFYLIRPGQD